RTLKVVSTKSIREDLSGDENVLPFQSGGAETLLQSFADCGFVVIALRGVDMPISQTYSFLYRFNACDAHQRVIARSNTRNGRAISLDDNHRAPRPLGSGMLYMPATLLHDRKDRTCNGRTSPVRW